MKTSKIISTLLLLAVLLSPACEFFKNQDHNPPWDCTLDEPFWLWYDNSTDCEEINITFTGEIEDSRCPATVDCIWAGRVDIQLIVDNELVDLGLPDDEQLGQSKAMVGNYEIELLDVVPYPTATDTIANASYRVKLQVTEL